MNEYLKYYANDYISSIILILCIVIRGIDYV